MMLGRQIDMTGQRKDDLDAMYKLAGALQVSMRFHNPHARQGYFAQQEASSFAYSTGPSPWSSTSVSGPFNQHPQQPRGQQFHGPGRGDTRPGDHRQLSQDHRFNDRGSSYYGGPPARPGWQQQHPQWGGNRPSPPGPSHNPRNTTPSGRPHNGPPATTDRPPIEAELEKARRELEDLRLHNAQLTAEKNAQQNASPNGRQGSQPPGPRGILRPSSSGTHFFELRGDDFAPEETEIFTSQSYNSTPSAQRPRNLGQLPTFEDSNMPDATQTQPRVRRAPAVGPKRADDIPGPSSLVSGIMDKKKFTFSFRAFKSRIQGATS